jgi:hypothetical protein
MINPPTKLESQFGHTEQLARLIDDKCCCLVQLRDLGGRQQQLIESGDLTQLLSLLANKQRLITLLQSIEGHLASFRHEDPESREWSSAHARERCAQQGLRCGELLDEILIQERRNETLMHQRKHSVADRLHQVHAQARASGAYRLHVRGKAQAESGPAGVGPTSGGDRHAVAQSVTRATTLDLSSDIR